MEERRYRLPFLISIPHGGTLIPEELSVNSSITTHDLFDDSDAYTQTIYNIGNTEAVHIFKYARAFVDVNRKENMLPPEHTDGVIKSATCYNRPIYKEGFLPDVKTIEKLIKRYYRPFHDSLKTALENPVIRMSFDCHSMADSPPDISESAEKRPFVNLGDNDGRACDPQITNILRDIFIRVFRLNKNDVTVNRPFKGGYITSRYGNNPKPWIQIELNRKLYLSEKWFNRKKLQIDEKRLMELNQLFTDVLTEFNRITQYE